MNIIPAIDLLDGKCVRLNQGDYNTKTIYSADPLDTARSFEDAGLKYLHLVDLDGARKGSVVNLAVLEQIAAKTSLQIDFGGGIKSDQDIAAVFNSGAAQVNIGSIALRKPELFLNWLNRYGAKKIILSADCRNRLIASGGWLEESDKDVVSYIRGYVQAGVSYVTCTDIGRDGMLNGPSLFLYQEILQDIPLRLTASGGISSLNDLGLLQQAGCAAAIVGKAIYEHRITLKELAALC